LRGQLFEFQTEKTGARVIIPAHPIAREIFERYREGNMPVFGDNGNLNKHIAKLCKAAGFNEQCLVTITKGGVKVTRYYEKWEMISIHSARRLFATNAHLAGIRPIDIMKITGHTTEKAFMEYIRISKMKNATRLADHPFFKG
jgi:hypothetical protein